MKTIIAGSRGYKDYEGVKLHMSQFFALNISLVICGEADGPDKMGKNWAKEHGIDYKSMPANWTTHDKAAGGIRNQKMVDSAGLGIFFWDGKSTGTRDCINRAVKKGIMIIIIPVKRTKEKEEDTKPKFDVTSLLS